MTADLATIIRCARGIEPADLVLKNGKVVNPFTGELLETRVAIAGGFVAGLGEDYEGRETIDLGGRVVSAGFIDAHLHMESTMLAPHEFARAVVPRGTTAVVCDPHEIANVLGVEGVRFMLDASEELPVTVFVMAPSCVPSSPLETAGATLETPEIEALLDHPRVLGLAEMMNYPGVLHQQEDVIAKLEMAHRHRVPIDGHSPSLSGQGLQAYVAAGPRSDHECTRLEEAREKLRAGMYVFIREGTTEHNLEDLLPLVSHETSRRCVLVSDDRHPDDLMDNGHMDHSVRLAVKHGVDPITAIQMVTLNPAERFRLWDRGAVAPGYRADLVVLDSLEDLNVEMVFSGGRLVARDGELISPVQPAKEPNRSSVNVAWGKLDLAIPAPTGRMRVIGIVPDQIVTESLELDAKRENGHAVADVSRDLLKLAVIERHHGSGNVGLGFVKGMGLKRGALASTVAHDSHNLIVAGTNDADMIAAARAVAETGGGFSAVNDGEVLAALPLPIAGLMSDRPLEEVRRKMDELLSAARKLGSDLPNPFMSLSFLALPVIPQLRLTDLGLVDVGEFRVVPLQGGMDRSRSKL
jgi:adenine deaminase